MTDPRAHVIPPYCWVDVPGTQLVVFNNDQASRIVHVEYGFLWLASGSSWGIRTQETQPERTPAQQRDLADQADESMKRYGYLRDAVLEAFNPRDGEEDESYLLAEAIEKARDYIRAQPCVCTEQIIYERMGCDRCVALGREFDAELPR